MTLQQLAVRSQHGPIPYRLEVVVFVPLQDRSEIVSRVAVLPPRSALEVEVAVAREYMGRARTAIVIVPVCAP